MVSAVFVASSAAPAMRTTAAVTRATRANARDGALTWLGRAPTRRARVVVRAAGPAALASERLGGKTAAVVGLAFYGAVEVGLAAMCAKYYSASGGDAATGAVCVQAVVFVCYQLLAPRQAAGMLTIARTL